MRSATFWIGKPVIVVGVGQGTDLGVVDRGPRRRGRRDVFTGCAFAIVPGGSPVPPKTAKATGGFRSPGPPRSFPLRGRRGGYVVRGWANVEAKPLAVTELGLGYRRYRLADPSAEEAMARSLSSYGQLAPVTACRRNDRAELLDGFKRHAAARAIAWPTLSVRLVEADERSAKAAIFGLNRTGRHPSELEEACSAPLGLDTKSSWESWNGLMFKTIWKPEDGHQHRPSGFPVWGNLFIGVGSTKPHRLFDFVFAFDWHAASNSAGVT